MNKKSLLYVAAALMLFGCEDYNELNFDGYKDLAVPTDVKSINYTLKKADYADLFKLSANKAVAEGTITVNPETGEADSTMYDAFEANASNNYFTDLVPAELYLPAFLADRWSTATDGSSAIITVNELAQVPELNQQIAKAYNYSLTEYDYAMVWEEEEGYEFFCPSHPASKYMNRILKDNFDDAEVGEVVMVNYEYAENDPATGNEEEGEVKYDAASSAPRRAAATAPTTSVLALYQWDGTSWKAIDADVIQPSEYAAMGMSSNSIGDPATYIPLYLEKNYPYAVNKQETTLVYYNKSNKLVAENYIYNGTEWTNTNLEEGIYNFNLIDGVWVYKTFKCVPVTEVTESGIYVMVADIKVNEETGTTEGRLFSPLGENKSYGYMPYASVSINEEGIIEACDAAENAFLTLTAVEDGFTMQDSYGRYIYMKGDYNSFNIGTEMVQPGSSWLFNVNEDGTYSVTNTMNDKVIMYDTGYTSYGCYPAKTDARLYVSVFKMVE